MTRRDANTSKRIENSIGKALNQTDQINRAGSLIGHFARAPKLDELAGITFIFYTLYSFKLMKVLTHKRR